MIGKHNEESEHHYDIRAQNTVIAAANHTLLAPGSATVYLGPRIHHSMNAVRTSKHDLS